MNDSDYQNALDAAIKHSTSSSVSVKPKQAEIKATSFGAGTRSTHCWGYGGGQATAGAHHAPSTIATVPPAAADSASQNDREYAHALAEALKAAKEREDLNKTITKRQQKGRRAFFRRRSSRSRSDAGIEPRYSKRCMAPSSSSTVAEDAQRREAAYLRVLNKDKVLVSGSYDEASLDVSNGLADFISKSENSSTSSSPVSSCSWDTSMHSNSSFDLLGDWEDGPLAITAAKGTNKLINPFDVFAIAP